MTAPLRLALVQQHATDDLGDNLRRAIAAVEQAAQQGARLVAFAELGLTPFYPRCPAGDNLQALAEPIPGPTTELFSKLAAQHKLVVVLNLFERRGAHTFDASPVIDADGRLCGVTRMVHIYEGPGFHEKGYYAPGPPTPIVHTTQVGRLGVAICYDRHFPEYMRLLRLQEAELVVVPQAGTVGEWPAGLFEAELQVASFQNGYFAALCNRVGNEGSLTFEGKSFVTAPDGRIVAQAPAGRDHLLLVDIDVAEVATCHAARHFLPDRRPEAYTDMCRSNES
ncbi:MAG: nitrilase-related carbon-nitrogen hydrolase [bacterium]|nr:carbon-nitrogen hydrolase family protein [candidate division KSB1 bacterium]MDH7561510.1 nitrilase-related carbon-nitrogen hydrolase [bacterium]